MLDRLRRRCLSAAVVASAFLLVGCASPGDMAQEAIGVDVTPLDGQEFMQAMMAPVPLATLPLLSELGWPTELLLHLLLDSIIETKTDATGKTTTRYLLNDPRAEGAHDEFSGLVSQLVGATADCLLHSRRQEISPSGPTYTAAAPLPTVEGLAAAKQAGLAFSEYGTGGYVFGTYSNEIRLACRAAGNPVQWQTFALLPRERLFHREQPSGTVGGTGTSYTATPRSPYGVLTYLGAVVQRDRARRANLAVGGRPLLPLDASSAVIARASLHGRDYQLGATDSGHGPAALAIAWQLMQLQSKSDKAPITSTVKLTP